MLGIGGVLTIAIGLPLTILSTKNCWSGCGGDRYFAAGITSLLIGTGLTITGGIVLGGSRTRVQIESWIGSR